jgi:hypothetical protein
MRTRIIEDGKNRVTVQTDGEFHQYWAPSGGGYIREISSDRPGTLGQQVCRRLHSTGDCLEYVPGYASVGDIIRRERRARRAEDKRS